MSVRLTSHWKRLAQTLTRRDVVGVVVARRGLNVDYCPAWLRQEVNHYLTVPRERAEEFSRTVQNLMGYRGHGPYLGRFAEDPDGFWLDKH